MIVATIITNNRAAEIADAVSSVKDHVDKILIVDTGVTDNTIDVAVRATRSTPYFCLHHDWIDFSEARNFALESARDLLNAEWVLIVDTDERVHFNGIDLRRALKNTKANVLLVESDDGFYPKEKFIRATAHAHYVGPTHEALIGGPREILRGVTFSELGKTEEQLKAKFERDAVLLTRQIGIEPNDPRWAFYLAASFEGLGDRKGAVVWYGSSAELDGMSTQAGWARYKQAEQLIALGEPKDALQAAAMGLVADPSSAECACVASAACTMLGHTKRARAWAAIAASVGRYKGVGEVRYGFRDLESLYEKPFALLAGTYHPSAEEHDQAQGHYVAARLAKIRSLTATRSNDMDRLSVSREAPAAAREEARTMLPQTRLQTLCPSAKHTQIHFVPPDGLLPMNPSICLHQGEVRCVIRAVNYTLDGRRYTVHDPHGVVRSKNYLGDLSLRTGVLLNANEMRDLAPSPRELSQIVGYEDIRLVSFKDALAGSATVCDRDPQGRRLIARLALDSKGNIRSATVQPSNQPSEKNWMPLTVAGNMTWIYSLDPTAILPGPLNPCPFKLEHLRGGAATAFDGGYLCVTHEVIDEPAERIYLHRFVRLDKKFNVTSVSRAWVFQHRGIEFCAGIVYRKGRVFLSYGLKDREAWFTTVDALDVQNMEWITP